jgi:polar amino acid transport system substrate-binding protein
MPLKFLLLAQIAIVLFYSTFISAETKLVKKLSLTADEWCPYNCIPSSDRAGYMVEIVKEVFKDYEVTYKLHPWKRAMTLARQNRVDGIVGAVDSESDGLFMPKNEQGLLDGHYFARSSVKWKISKISDIKKYNLKLGIVAGYGYANEVDKFIKDNPDHTYSSYGEKAMPKLIQLLKKGRIDLITDDRSVFWYKVNELKLNSKLFKSVGRPGKHIAPKNLYVSFYDKKNAKILSDGMIKLRKTGKLKKILNKYNLKDWRK